MTIGESLSRGTENAYIRSTNAIKYMYNTARGKTVYHYRLVPGKELTASESYNRLNKELGFNNVAGLLSELSEIESRSLKITEVKKEVEKIYFKLGPYARTDISRFMSFQGRAPTGDIDLAHFERRLFVDGTTDYDGAARDFTDARQMQFEIRIPHITTPLTVSIPFPKIIPVTFPDESVQKLGIYGRKKTRAWIDVYGKLLDEQIIVPVTNQLIKYYETKLAGDHDALETAKVNIHDNLEVMNKAFKNTIDLVLNKYTHVKEKAYEEYFKTEVYPLFERLATIKNELGVLIPSRLKYQHTYKKIKVNRYVYDPASPRVEKFRILFAGFEIGQEVEPGLDENGWPLEVDDENGRITGTPYAVLLDFWYHRAVRTVPAEWVEDCDLLDIVCWLNNGWDEYRDDLRDGRYHPGSLTAIEYAMAANPTIWGEWEGKRESSLSNADRNYTMHSVVGDVSGEREPSHLSPAFDKRAIPTINDWIHIGKKRYYGNNEHINEVIKEDNFNVPHISTRGACIYIIERVTREMKLIEQARQVLERIGKDMGGFDYGPRKFGEAFPKDPFDIDVTKLNVPPKPYQKYNYLDHAQAMKKGESVISFKKTED